MGGGNIGPEEGSEEPLGEGRSRPLGGLGGAAERWRSQKSDAAEGILPGETNSPIAETRELPSQESGLAPDSGRLMTPRVETMALGSTRLEVPARR